MKAYNYSLPPIPENERIYFNVPYMAKGLAMVTNCGFDSSKKLWFTGCNNTFLYVLVNKYKINKNTSENAKKLLDEALKKQQIANHP